jgi:DmsE family decaheme c-type cytochrome
VRLVTALAIASLLLIAPLPSATGQEQAAAAEYSRKGADTCLSCHDDAKTALLFKTRHAVPSDPRGPFGHGQLQCESCHGPGADHSKRLRRGQERPHVIDFTDSGITPIETQNGQCLDCHGEDVGFGWHSGSHPVDEVSCAGCHSAHKASDPVLFTSSQAPVCYDCHQQVRTETMKAFAHPVSQGKMDCGACHSMHGDDAAAGFAQLTAIDTCHQCHAETRGPHLWEHAPATEDCGLCHAPHGSNQPAMLVQRAPLLCQSCHSQSGHPSIAFDTSGLPDGMPSQYLLGQSCLNCHSQVHGSNHPSGSNLMR